MKIRKQLPWEVAFAQIHLCCLSLLPACASTVSPPVRAENDTGTRRCSARADAALCRAETGPETTALRVQGAARQVRSSASR
jgi:hypothetical protein